MFELVAEDGLPSFSEQEAEGGKWVFISLSRLLPLAEGEGSGSVQVLVVTAEQWQGQGWCSITLRGHLC